MASFDHHCFFFHFARNARQFEILPVYLKDRREFFIFHRSASSFNLVGLKILLISVPGRARGSVFPHHLLERILYGCYTSDRFFFLRCSVFLVHFDFFLSALLPQSGKFYELPQFFFVLFYYTIFWKFFQVCNTIFNMSYHRNKSLICFKICVIIY